MGGEALAELLFMMVILKIPVVYLCAVVYWAVRAEPRPLEPARAPAFPTSPDDRPSLRTPRRPRSSPRPRRPRPRPHGGPVRSYARHRVARMRSQTE